MAPRSRRRKGRLSRMDAAVDAMLPYGFAASHVREVAKLLLKEYGGNEGWPFIEEFSYKELIEAILRDENKADEHRNPSEDKSCGGEGAPAAPSGRASDVAVDDSPAVTVAFSGAAEEPGNLISDDGKVPKDILHEEKSPIISGTRVPGTVNNTPPPVNNRRRVHSCGCIHNNEEEEEEDNDFINLEASGMVLGARETPAGKLYKCSIHGKRRRRSRWDQRPDQL